MSQAVVYCALCKTVAIPPFCAHCDRPCEVKGCAQCKTVAKSDGRGPRVV